MHDLFMDLTIFSADQYQFLALSRPDRDEQTPRPPPAGPMNAGGTDGDAAETTMTSNGAYFRQPMVPSPTMSATFLIRSWSSAARARTESSRIRSTE